MNAGASTRFIRSRSASHLLFVAAGLLLSADLVLLWAARGDNVTGWELVGPAEGALNYHRDGLLQALQTHLWHSRHFQYYAGTSSVLFSVLPGSLHVHAPWLLWGQVTALVLSLGFFFLFVKLLDLDRGIFTLAWAASGTLMTLSIMGIPHVAAAFPFCLAIPTVLLRSTASSAFPALALDVILWAVVYELALHSYEPGRSVCLVPLIGAVTLPAVTMRRRLLWALCSVVMAWTFARFTSTSFNYRLLFADLPATLALQPQAAWLVFKALFLEWRLDYPFLALLAVFALFAMRKHRLFWSLLLCLSLSTMIAVATIGILEGYTDTENLRARRFGVVAFVAIAMVATAWREGDRRYFRQIACTVLLGGALLALYRSYCFYASPSPSRSLPFTESSADFHIDRAFNLDAARLAAYAERTTEPHFVLYGYSTYAENTTDPICFPERVLLYMGPQKFLERLHFIDERGKVGCRYACVPMYDKQILSTHIGNGLPFYLHVYREKPRTDVPYLSDGVINDASWVGNTLEHVKVAPAELGLTKFVSFRILP